MTSMEFLGIFNIADIHQEACITDSLLSTQNEVKIDLFFIDEGHGYIVSLLVEIEIEEHEGKIDLLGFVG